MEEIAVGIKSREEVIDTFGKDTEVWEEAQLKYETPMGDLERRISLGIGFEWIRGI